MSQRLDKPLPPIPPLSVLSSTTSAESEDEAEAMVLPFTGLPPISMTPNTTKREYALRDLLRSERTYARDLILLRDFQIPLASGRLSSMSGIWPAVDATICQYLGLGPAASDTNVSPTAPLASLSVSPHPLTAASSISAVSSGSIFTLRPMKTRDVNIVFSNIQELAAFSEEFLHRLESALGQFIEGNEGEDSVGTLFLKFIPQMELLYKTYIMNHPRALERYHRLSKTFQFDVYFPQSQILAHKCSNAWDLPSLLIKPVQRLQHYPQLLDAILSETPENHRDKPSLIEARTQMEEIARQLNTRRRQQKVVREVLTSAGLVDVATPAGYGAAVRTTKKSGLKVGHTAFVGLGRITAPQTGQDKAREGPEMDRVAQAVKAGSERLRGYEEFVVTFTRETALWADMMRYCVGALEEWAHSFARVISTDPDEECPKVLASFLTLVSHLRPLVRDKLKAGIGEDLVPMINTLKNTIVAPMCLLEEMQRLEPIHYKLLRATKSSLPQTLLKASPSYVALRELLMEELPTYLTLLDRGMATCIRKLAHMQWRLYRDVRELWRDLWDAVAVEGETNSGADETLRVWSCRFSEIEHGMMHLNILRPPEENPAPERQRMKMKAKPGDGARGTPSMRAAVASESAADHETFERDTSHITSREKSPSPYPAMSGPAQQQEDSVQVPAIPTMYKCRVVQPCEMRGGVVYQGRPFFTLVVGEVYEVLALAEVRHLHPRLPLLMHAHMDFNAYSEGCLLFVRNGTGDIGWASDHFMLPLDE